MVDLFDNNRDNYNRGSPGDLNAEYVFCPYAK